MNPSQTSWQNTPILLENPYTYKKNTMMYFTIMVQECTGTSSTPAHPTSRTWDVWKNCSMHLRQPTYPQKSTHYNHHKNHRTTVIITLMMNNNHNIIKQQQLPLKTKNKHQMITQKNKNKQQQRHKTKNQ